jgi:hypothetical protein
MNYNGNCFVCGWSLVAGIWFRKGIEHETADEWVFVHSYFNLMDETRSVQLRACLFALHRSVSGRTIHPWNCYMSRFSVHIAQIIMKTFLLSLLILSLILFILQACIIVSTQKTETQAFKVVKKEKDLEIRFYPEVTMATITSSAKNYKELGSTGFRQLAGYIFGGNDQDQKIAMTAPVHMEMRNTAASMSFVMPAKYNKDNLPMPKNAAVIIQTAAAEYVAVITFGGFASETDIRIQTEKLRSALEAYSIPYYGNFRYLGYNPPYQLAGRKNEIIVSVRWNAE